MYGWIWRRLPGPVPVKALLSLLLALGAVYVLFQWVFPWAEPLLPFSDVTVDQNGGAHPSGPATPGPAPGRATPGATAPGPGRSLNGAAAPRTAVGTLSSPSGLPGTAGLRVLTGVTEA